MQKVKILLLIVSYFSLNAQSAYFYCLTTTGVAYNFTPNTKIPFKVISQPLVQGGEIKLGSYYETYSINSKDISGGKFSSTFGLATPYGYFIFPNEPQKKYGIQDLVMDLRQQCQKIIKASNHPDHVFSEIRVSESLFSGVSSYLKTGYPLVYLNTPTKSNEQNIFRVKI
jgi:hypothetical protein